MNVILVEIEYTKSVGIGKLILVIGFIDYKESENVKKQKARVLRFLTPQ